MTKFSSSNSKKENDTFLKTAFREIHQLCKNYASAFIKFHLESYYLGFSILL